MSLMILIVTDVMNVVHVLGTFALAGKKSHWPKSITFLVISPNSDTGSKLGQARSKDNKHRHPSFGATTLQSVQRHPHHLGPLPTHHLGPLLRIHTLPTL